MAITLDGLDAGTRSETTNPHHARRWWVLVILGIAQLMVVLDTTIVNIALPSAQRALGFSNSDRQWVVTAYALAFGSLLLLGGRLADLLGRKRLFMIGLVGFAVASAVGGAANDFTTLVVARAVQGGFGAMLAPAGLSLLTTTFTIPTERAKAFGIYGAIAGGGGAIGLLLGGILTEYLSWRWCMYVNLVFAALAFVGAAILLHNQVAEDRPRLDVPGVITVAGGVFGVVFGFSHAETGGWANGVTLGFIGAGVALLALFVVIQAKTANPLLPLRVLLDRNRSGSFLAIFLSGAGLFGLSLFLTYYLQQTLGYSAVQTGLAFLPMTGMLVIAATTSSSLLGNRVGPRWLVAPGMLLSAVGLVLLTRLTVSSSYLSGILPATMIFGVGLGLIFSSAMSTGTQGVQPEDAGVGSALLTTSQQIGGSLGTALLNTLFASAVASYVSSHVHLGGTAAAVARHASMHGYIVAFWWSAGIFALGVVVCGLLLRGEVAEIDPDAEPVFAL